jgi:hypothetical protein
MLAPRSRPRRSNGIARGARAGRWMRPTLFLALAASLACASASAQSHEPTARDRSEAADAYDRGVSAFLSENYGAAAHWFETANRLAPSPAALMQAIRANDRAGNELRSATLALRLADEYPDEAQAIRATRQILADAGTRYYLVTVNCSEECAIEVNGALEEHNRFFVEPNRDVSITAEFPGGRLSEEVSGEAGDTGEVAFTAPPPPPEAPAVAATGGSSGDGDGLSRGLFWTGAGLTGGATIGLVTAGSLALAGVDEYEANPSSDALEAGQRKERWTNAMIGVTSGLAAATAIIAIFTDWAGDDDGDGQGVAPTVGLTRDGISIGAEGRF